MEFDQASQLLQQQIDQNNAWSAAQAQKQMDFQERMSNTAHQREVADLQASGLNPILSAHGAGASTPSGAMANGEDSAPFASLLETMIQTENLNARAALRASSGSSYSSGAWKNEPNDLLWYFLKDITGNEDKNVAEIASNAAKNTRGLISAGLTAISNGINKLTTSAKSAVSGNSFLQTLKQGFVNRAKSATPNSLIGSRNKTFAGGTKNRVSSRYSWKK